MRYQDTFKILSAALVFGLGLQAQASMADMGHGPQGFDSTPSFNSQHYGPPPQFANSGADFIDARQARQRWLIHQNARRGELTPAEARRLWDEQRSIESMERRFESDGVLTGRERYILNRELDEARWNIQRQSHDDDYRWQRDYPSNWYWGWR
jgi:hypothetical protein